MAEERETVANSDLLYKHQTRFGQTYKTYFFRFLKPAQSGGCYTLAYNATKHKVVEIALHNVLSVDRRKAKSQDYAFVIHCLDNKHQFACLSLNDMERWLATLRKELLAAPPVAKPGEDTVGVEIDPTALSSRLQLGGLYLLEVTPSDIILWLPRSRKETIRWSLGCIHSLDHLKPKGASKQSIIIELNEFSATGQGTLIFKTENGEHIVELVEKYTGKKVLGLKTSLAAGQKSMRKRTTSQENIRAPANFKMDTLLEAPASFLAAPHTMDDGFRQRGKTSINIRRYGSEGTTYADAVDIPALPQRTLPATSGLPARPLTPVFLTTGFQRPKADLPDLHIKMPTPFPPRSPQPGRRVEMSPTVSVTPAPRRNSIGSSIVGNGGCGDAPPLPPRTPDMYPTTSVGSTSSDNPSIMSTDELPPAPPSPMFPSASPSPMFPSASPLFPTPGSSPIMARSPRCPSPLFIPGVTGGGLQSPPALPPRPPSPSPRRANLSVGDAPPLIPPRPHDSFEDRTPRAFTMGHPTPLHNNGPPPVSPRGANTLPQFDSCSPRQSYENSEVRPFVRPR